MKRKLIIIAIAAFIASACTTNRQTASNYVDDLYYWPGDDIPVLSKEEIIIEKERAKNNDNILIVSELGETGEGTKTLDNYVYSDEMPDWYDDVQAYNMNHSQNNDTDTILIPDEKNCIGVYSNYSDCFSFCPAFS